MFSWVSDNSWKAVLAPFNAPIRLLRPLFSYPSVKLCSLMPFLVSQLDRQEAGGHSPLVPPAAIAASHTFISGPAGISGKISERNSAMDP